MYVAYSRKTMCNTWGAGGVGDTMPLAQGHWLYRALAGDREMRGQSPTLQTREISHPWYPEQVVGP
jgi:hypothetical protein